jgi:hypothetical protein
MQARKLLVGAAYGPDTLKVICLAFDDAWAEIKRHFDDDPLTAECTRIKLANAILRVAREDSRDAEELKKQGLRELALCHGIASAVEVATGQRKRSSRYWRAYADEMLAIAEHMTDPERKRIMAGIAETYVQLAGQAATVEAERARRLAQKR